MEKLHILYNDSVNHLKDVNLTYFEHMKRSFTLSFHLAKTSMLGIIHGFIPGLFDTAITDCNNKLTEELKKID